jgi:hypothetical protein
MTAQDKITICGPHVRTTITAADTHPPRGTDFRLGLFLAWAADLRPLI